MRSIFNLKDAFFVHSNARLELVTCYMLLGRSLFSWPSSSILLLLVLGVTNILDSVRCILLIKVARNVGIMGYEHDWTAFLTALYRTEGLFINFGIRDNDRVCVKKGA